MKRLTYIIIGLLGMITVQAQDIKERIHVETDKDFYLAGEQMGLKLHATDVQGKPQEFSRIAYVELLGDKENTVRLKVEMKNASGEATIQLPYTLASGVYDLVAYTRWMRNEGEEVFFRRQIGHVQRSSSVAPSKMGVANLTPSSLPARPSTVSKI